MYNTSSLSLEFYSTEINKSAGDILIKSFECESYLAYLGVEISNSN